jgi:hypothetical protein
MLQKIEQNIDNILYETYSDKFENELNKTLKDE